jgi:hypothetical protein
VKLKELKMADIYYEPIVNQMQRFTFRKGRINIKADEEIIFVFPNHDPICARVTGVAVRAFDSMYAHSKEPVDKNIAGYIYALLRNHYPDLSITDECTMIGFQIIELKNYN